MQGKQAEVFLSMKYPETHVKQSAGNSDVHAAHSPLLSLLLHGRHWAAPNLLEENYPYWHVVAKLAISLQSLVDVKNLEGS